jgi:hypothetical protein
MFGVHVQVNFGMIQAPGGRDRFVRLLFQYGFHWNYQRDAHRYLKVLDEDAVCRISIIRNCFGFSPFVWILTFCSLG